jgi:L-ascorbate metabolism protein UlaG (beta-lactamase superfamily)
MQNRRQFLIHTAAASTLTVLPFTARGDGHAADSFPTANGAVEIYPITHASFVMSTPGGVIYVDPVGDAASYTDFPDADLVLITHEHGDHFNQDTLDALVGDTTVLITNPNVYDALPAAMQAKATKIANGEDTMFGDVSVDAIPAYNTTEDRLNFHPAGRDNGYVVTVDGCRVYISGDTEDVPEMRALRDIDIAFVCMNLPFTMDANAAANAVNEFKPANVYPYHYRGRDNGTQDPMAFAELLADGIKAKMGGWYA